MVMTKVNRMWFTLNECEASQLRDWLNTRKLDPTPAKGNGTQFHCEVVETGVGCVLTVTDKRDNTKVQINDYESW